MGNNKDYSDLDSAPRKVETQDVKVSQRPVAKLSLVALVVGILTVPAAIMPFIGIFVAMVGLVVGIVAVIRASRRGTQRAYAIAGLVLSILAMAIALAFTTIALQAADGCETLRGTEFQECVKEKNS